MDPTQPPLLEAPESAFMVFIVQFFLIVCLFLSLIFDVTELILFTLFILTLGLGAYLWSRAALNHLECDLALNRIRLFPDEQLALDIHITNSKLLPVLVKVDLFISESFSGSGRGRWISEEAGLLWYQKTFFSRNLWPNQRGVYNLGPPRLRGSDLFGFYFRQKKTLKEVEVIVYPRIINVRPVTFPKRDFFGIPGKKSPIEDPVFIFGTRDYQPGRPARRIHWKVSARHNRLQEKLCEPAEQEKVLFILDVEQFKKGEDEQVFEQMVEVIASLVLEMERHGTAVGFVTNGQLFGDKPRIVPLSRSTGQVGIILETLARVNMTKALPASDIISRGYRVPWGASAIYFCSTHSRETEKMALLMKKINTPIRFVVIQLPDSDDGMNKKMLADTVPLKWILAEENRNK